MRFGSPWAEAVYLRFLYGPSRGCIGCRKELAGRLRALRALTVGARGRWQRDGTSRGRRRPGEAVVFRDTCAICRGAPTDAH